MFQASTGANPQRAILDQHDSHQIGGIFGTELFHDASAVHFDRARADAESAAGFLIGSTPRDTVKNIPFPRREPFAAMKIKRENAVILAKILPSLNGITYANDHARRV